MTAKPKDQKDPNEPTNTPAVMAFIKPQFAQISDQLSQLVDAVCDLKKDLQTNGDKLDGATTEIARLSNVLDGVKASLVHTQAEVFTVVNETIPAVVDHVADVQTASIIKQIEQDVWNRKRNILISGLPGPAGESDEETEALVKDWIQNTLGVDVSAGNYVVASHRLNHKKEKSGIIVRFSKFSMAGTVVTAAARKGRELKDKRISVVIDLPPVLRSVRKSLLDKRAEIVTANPNLRGHIKLVQQWPFVQLVTQPKLPFGANIPRPPLTFVDHDWGKEKVAAQYVGVPSIRSDAVDTLENIQMGIGRARRAAGTPPPPAPVQVAAGRFAPLAAPAAGGPLAGAAALSPGAAARAGGAAARAGALAAAAALGGGSPPAAAGGAAADPIAPI